MPHKLVKSFPNEAFDNILSTFRDYWYDHKNM